MVKWYISMAEHMPANGKTRKSWKCTHSSECVSLSCLSKQTAISRSQHLTRYALNCVIRNPVRQVCARCVFRSSHEKFRNQRPKDKEWEILVCQPRNLP